MIPHYGVTEEQRIELYKIAVAHSDVGEALVAVRLFMNTVKDMQDTNYLPLQDSIVIAYGRAFTRNKPYGKLDKSWSQFNIKEHKEMHDKLLDTRHKLVAHSDIDYRKVQIVPDGYSPSKNIPPSKGLAITVSSKKFSLSAFPVIEAVCLDVGGRLQQEMFDKLDQYYGSIKLPKTSFDLL